MAHFKSPKNRQELFAKQTGASQSKSIIRYYNESL